MTKAINPEGMLIAGGRFQAAKDAKRTFSVKGVNGETYTFTMGWAKECRVVASEAFAKGSGNRELMGDAVTAFIGESGINDPGAARKVAESITRQVIRWYRGVDPNGSARLGRTFVASDYWLRHRAYVRRLHEEGRNA